MGKIRAVTVTQNVTGRLGLSEVDAPVPGRSEALVRVSAISLNLGEVRRSQSAPVGWRPGWDLAGTVVRAAADGSGPAADTRVVGFLGEGGWAEQVAVPTHSLAALPDNVSFAQAATLPVAGLTALYALEKGGSLLGQKVLVTGASGGVGIFALELARQAGAYVVGVVRQADKEAAVREAGAHEVVIEENLESARAFGRYHTILESVGGNVLSKALSMIAPGGICVLFGASASAEVNLDARAFFSTGRASLYGFILFSEVGDKPAAQGLARLAGLVSDGRLRPLIDVEASWQEIGQVAQKLLDRKITGKAILHVQD